VRRAAHVFGDLVSERAAAATLGLATGGVHVLGRGSLSSRRRRSSTCAASAAICASRAASCAAASSSRARAASRSRALTDSSSATRARSHDSSSDVGGSGVPDTSRTLPKPAIRHQPDTPSRPRELSSPQPSQQRPHRRSLRLNSHRSTTAALSADPVMATPGIRTVGMPGLMGRPAADFGGVGGPVARGQALPGDGDVGVDAEGAGEDCGGDLGGPGSG